LPLLAEFEIIGAQKGANVYEQYKQKRYDYYIAGNSAVKHRHSTSNVTMGWRTRSVCKDNHRSTMEGDVSGGIGYTDTRNDRGLAPIFKV
jgi:hypothetical protein